MCLLQKNMTNQLHILCNEHSREECARIMGLSISSVNNFLSKSSSQNITVEQFTVLYDTLKPEDPRITLCKHRNEYFECTYLSAERDNYQSRCRMMKSMRSDILHLASYHYDMRFVVTKRKYPDLYPLRKDQIITIGPYYLDDLLQSSMPGASELAMEIHSLRKRYKAVEQYIPAFQKLYALKSPDGKYAKFSSEVFSSSNYKLVSFDNNPTAFAVRENAERLLHYAQNEFKVVEFKPSSAFYEIAEYFTDVPSECLATEPGQWKEHFSTTQQGEEDMSEYHVVLINQETGNAELWKDFVPGKELEQVKIEAEKSYPKYLCVVRDSRQYPNPMTLVDECDGGIIEVLEI